MDSKEIGNQGENIAVGYLKKKGYKILSRNFKNKWGEIDIVASPPHQKFWCGGKKKIIFCEVKTIQEREGFLAEDEIDRKKMSQLRKMAQIYLSQKKISFETPWQIDILAVEINPEVKEPTIRHLPNAIEDMF